jgi:hypothetical protein
MQSCCGKVVDHFRQERCSSQAANTKPQGFRPLKDVVSELPVIRPERRDEVDHAANQAGPESWAEYHPPMITLQGAGKAFPRQDLKTCASLTRSVSSTLLRARFWIVGKPECMAMVLAQFRTQSKGMKAELPVRAGVQERAASASKTVVLYIAFIHPIQGAKP